MNTKSVLGVVLALGVAFALVAGSGIGAGIFGETTDASGTIGDLADDASVSADENGEGGLVGNVAGDNEPTVVGLTISGGQFIAQLVAAVAVVPVILIRLGFPMYFAVPVGGIAQIIAFIGLIQYVTGRQYL